MKRLFAWMTALCLVLSLGAALADAQDAEIWSLPGKAEKLSGSLMRTKVKKVAQITGEDSMNRTDTRFNVYGTDLGSMTAMNGRVYMFGGDTFGDAQNGDWRSNVLFIIEDDDPSDGLTIVDVAKDKWGRAKECIPSRKVDNVQMTVIPTDIFSVGDTLYTIAMSVTHWGSVGGTWDCGYSVLAKSTDEGQTWKRLNRVQWPGESGFMQTAHCQVGDTMYLWGIPAGRFGGVSLMKVPVDAIEDYEAYSYFTGCDEAGDPQWISGSAGVMQAKTIIDAPVGEISVIYNPYLGNFIMTYLDEKQAAVVVREGVTPWGEWGKTYVLASSAQYPSLYGGYMCDCYIEEEGKVFYFAMSQYFPIYNILWMRAELPDIVREQ